MKKLLLIAIAICLTSCQKVQEIQLQNIYSQTTQQQLKQWDIVNRSGTDAEKWVHAGIVAACYLQEGNETKYKEWSEIAKSYDPMNAK
jgi:hypothetical protein